MKSLLYLHVANAKICINGFATTDIEAFNREVFREDFAPSLTTNIPLQKQDASLNLHQQGEDSNNRRATLSNALPNDETSSICLYLLMLGQKLTNLYRY